MAKKKRGRPKGSRNRKSVGSGSQIRQVKSVGAGGQIGGGVVDAYQQARSDLENRREEILAELEEINAVLGEHPFPLKGKGKRGPGRKAKRAKSGSTRSPRGAVKDAVLKALSKTTPMTAKTIAEKTNLDPQQINNTLTQLKKSGEAKKAKTGKGVVLA